MRAPGDRGEPRRRGERPRVALVLLHHNMEVDVCAFGMRHVHAAVKRAGSPVRSFYVGFEPESQTGVEEFKARVAPECMAALRRFAPDVVGFSVFSCYVPIIRHLLARVRRELPGVLTVVGGPDPTLSPERLLPDVDYLFRGESEQAFPEFLARLAHGGSLETAPNVWCRRDGRLHQNPMQPLAQDLDALALPDFEDDGGHVYVNSRFPQRHGSMQWYSMMAARGCPYKCEFCVNPVQRQVYRGLGRFLRRRSVSSVIAELVHVKRRNPDLRKIYFYDEVFTTELRWLDTFADAYADQIRLPFFCQTDPRIDNDRAVPLLARAGVRWLSMGIQGPPRVAREYYDRSYEPQDVLRVARLGRQYGIVNIFDLIIDEPFSTDEDRRELLEILLQMPRPFVMNTYSLLYFPGYLTTERALAAGLIQPRDVEGSARERFNWNRFLAPGKDPRVLFWECLYDLAAHSSHPANALRRLADDPGLRAHPEPFVEVCLATRQRRRVTYIPETELHMVEDGNTTEGLA